MGLFTLEHGTLAYRADFVLYGVAVAGLAVALPALAPPAHALQLTGLVGAGLAAWSLIEYGLHRFVLHGLAPFRHWHAEHHRRPRALICAPTIVTAALFAVLVFLPALWLAPLWRACALTLGVLVGYQAYAVTHHAIHHWRARGPWLRERKRRHALHHQPGQIGSYGVTSSFWDRALVTAAVRQD